MTYRPPLPLTPLILRRMLVAAKSFLGWHRRGPGTWRQGGTLSQSWQLPWYIRSVLFQYGVDSELEGLYRTKSSWRNFYWSCPRLMSQRVYGPYGASKGHNHIFIVVASFSSSSWVALLLSLLWIWHCIGHCHKRKIFEFYEENNLQQEREILLPS